MGFFRKKDRVIDLSERYRNQQRQVKEIKKESAQKEAEAGQSSGFLSFFSNVGSQNAANTPAQANNLDDSDEKKKKLAKRLGDMTDKLEDISNQIYRLQQRIEVLERRANINY